MELQNIQLIKTVLGENRIHYRYYRDKHAVYLLHKLVENNPLSIREIRQSPFGRLLNRPLIREALRHWGDGMVTAERVLLLQPSEQESFRLGFDSWGNRRRKDWRYEQTSRRGFNLVVQLNFSGVHNKRYRKLAADRLWHPFKAYGHPTQADREFTLAWSRVDIADDFSYALIEEVQNDWLRYAEEELIVDFERTLDTDNQVQLKRQHRSRHGFEVEEFRGYLEYLRKNFRNVWAEAVLAATIWVLLEEIGVERIFYHTYELGAKLKDCSPPRSIYTQLPKKFCFRETEACPLFLEGRVKRYRKKGEAKFFVLDFQEFTKGKMS